jgi:hypothetical protein
MTNDEYDPICRTLEFYKDTNTKIHFNIISGKDKGLFRNGIIKEVSVEHKVFIIIDNILGPLQYLFEEIDSNSVRPYKEKNGGER